MSLLEERYRFVLRLLPASYRAEWEDEMVATFLEATGDLGDEEGARPTLSEIASVAALAVRVRLGGAGASSRSVAWGEVVRLLAVLGLFASAALSCIGLVSTLGLYAFGPPPGLGIDYERLIGPALSAARLWYVVGLVASIAWIAAYLTLVRGHRRTAKVLALLALVPVLNRLVVDVPFFGVGVLIQSMPAVVPVLALLAGFHRDAPPVRHTGWLAALPVVAGAALGATQTVVVGWAAVQPQLGMWLAAGGLYDVPLLAAGLAYIWVHTVAPARRTPSWPLALAFLMVPLLGSQIATFPGGPYSSDAAVRGVADVVLGQIVAVVLVGLVLLVLGVRALRQLPATPGRSGDPAHEDTAARRRGSES